ncbi:MAG: ATP phosphoribosyltransferase, partial [Chloroflexota bacterium]|nr:ATP phosphoribosyltransferase [Chloroflexota bacterium]
MEGKGLRLALPKGHLQSQTLDLFGEAAYHIQGYSEESRSYRPTLDDDEIILKVLRAQEIPMYVESGSHDVGVTGDDWVRESRADVIQLCDLEYGWVKMVLAVPSVPNGVTSFKELLDRYWDKGVRISTEYLRLAEAYIMSQETYRSRTSLAPSIITPWSREITGSPVEVILSFGATEAKPPEDAEAVIENTTSLRTLLENQLRVIDTVLP